MTQHVGFKSDFGTIIVDLDPSAPNTVSNFLGYVTTGAYSGSFLHRLVPGFVLQGGGYKFTNDTVQTVPQGAPVANEYSAARPNAARTIALAKLGGNPDSATNQFFFNLADNSSTLGPQNNGGYSVFGTVTQGWDVVEGIAALPIYNAGSPFDQLPVHDYAGGDVTGDNLVTISGAVLFGSMSAVRSDVTGDGTADVLLQSGGTVVDWVMQDGRYQSGNQITSGAAGYRVVGKGDFNGDGTGDVLLQSGGTVVDWIMANGAYQSGNIVTTGAAGFQVVGTGDFNSDGTSDVLLQSDDGSTVVEWLMRDGAYLSGQVLTTNASGFGVVGTGDFNGDGTSDILLQNGGTVVEWTMKNGQYQSGSVITTGAAGFQVVGTGDFNGDATDDVLLQSGDGSTVVDWIIRNSAYQSGNVLTTGAAGFRVAGTGYYDGDATADILLQGGGTVVDWIMRDGQYQSGNVLTTGAAGFAVV